MSDTAYPCHRSLSCFNFCLAWCSSCGRRGTLQQKPSMRNASLPSSTSRGRTTACEIFSPSVNKIAAWSQEKWIKPWVDQRVEEAKEEEGCWGPTERCTCEFCPSICEFTFLFLSAFWRISGSGQSTKGENLLGKTYHKHTPQVIDNIVLFQAAEFCMYFCARDVLDCVSLTPDQFESTLWKKGKDNKNFLRRVFLLSRSDFTLRYFVKGDVSCPFAVLLL